MLAAVSPLAAEIEAGSGVTVDACASDPQHLGLSRIVEIDTTGGVNVGGERPDSTHFLNDGEVVLTFDDGPMKAYTREILKALADQCTKATFFMVGQMALADPEMVKEVAAAGHTIGTHTWSHKNLRLVSAGKAEQEIEAAISTVSKAKGSPATPLFRFPYLSSSKQAEAYLKTRNVGAVWIDIDSKDYLTHDPRVVEHRIIAQLVAQKKGIVLMHDIHAWTAKMLPDLLKDLHDRGFKIVHMVPKGMVQTIASYDAAADKAIAAKAAERAARPLANHSLVWSMEPAPEPVVGGGTATNSPSGPQKVAARVRRVMTKPSIAEDLPADAPVPVPETAKLKKTKQNGEGFPWQWDIFAN